MTMMWGFHSMQRPISTLATTARIFTISMPFTLEYRKRQKGDKGRCRIWRCVLCPYSTLIMSTFPPSLLSLFLFSNIHHCPLVFFFPNFQSFLFHPFFLTSLSGLPQIPPGRKITCHQWKRLPLTMTSTWPQQGVVPPLRNLLPLCCFQVGQQSCLTTTPESAHNAPELPTTHTCLLINNHSCTQMKKTFTKYANIHIQHTHTVLTVYEIILLHSG